MSTDKEKLPLVSIIIPTYNSSEYIVETLESVKTQTYPDIELIVTDDCSGDNTVEICSKWLLENKARFVRAELIASQVNTGIAPNNNRGISIAEGEWIKVISGDDILMKECIKTNIEFIRNSDVEVSFLFSRLVWFKVNSSNRKLTNSDEAVVNRYWQNMYESFFCLKAKQQYIKLLKRNRLPAPTAFINRKTFLSLGGFDERFPMIDDYPLWLRATKNNYKLYFTDNETVLYRKHDHAVSNSVNINLRYLKDSYRIYKAMRINRYTIPDIFFHLSVNVDYINLLTRRKFGKKTILNYMLQLLDPHYLRSRFSSRYKEENESLLNGIFTENQKFN